MENNLIVTEPLLGLIRPIATPKQLVEAHKEFANIISEVLEEGKDFGTIPGTKTPTLYKPGAERLLASAGCRPKFTLVTQDIDHNYAVKWRKRKKVWNNAHRGDKTFRWETEDGESVGLYRYVYKCEIVRIETGQVIGEGDGSCSTMESKYVESPRDYENTIVKMATKRALVAATLSAFGLSNRFTQDMEDIKDNERSREEVPQEEPIYQEQPEQKKNLAKFAKEAGVEDKTALQEISAALKGIPMHKLRDGVREYVDMPFKQQT